MGKEESQAKQKRWGLSFARGSEQNGNIDYGGSGQPVKAVVAGADDETRLLDELFDELYPLLRSITGEGYRESLEVLKRHIPFEMMRVPSGTQVFDWTVPDEWVYRSARLTGPDGDVVVDADDFNLGVMNYSAPIDANLTLDELRQHLFTLPELPKAVPYVTSYYERRWGFCMSQEQLDALPTAGKYHAFIDTDFVAGHVDLAHCVLHGESDAEILVSSYLCHPSLANNELSGPLVLLALYKRLSRWDRRRFTYRFVINPETIGSLCYLHLQGDHLRRTLAGGLVLTCLGGPLTDLTYKLSRTGDSVIDKVMAQRSTRAPERLRLRAFNPASGSDERQYGSPGFQLPVGQIARTPYAEYDGYHNSFDTKEFMGIEPLIRAAGEIEQLLREVEVGGYFKNRSPFGEPQLGRRDLWPTLNDGKPAKTATGERLARHLQLEQILNLLCYSDGTATVVEIADRLGCRALDLAVAIERLEAVGLLEHMPYGPA